jgi:hypothetical protein
LVKGLPSRTSNVLIEVPSIKFGLNLTGEIILVLLKIDTEEDPKLISFTVKSTVECIDILVFPKGCLMGEAETDIDIDRLALSFVTLIANGVIDKDEAMFVDAFAIFDAETFTDVVA